MASDQPACLEIAWSIWSRKPMPVFKAICWVDVICVAWWDVGKGTATSGYFEDFSNVDGKCSESSKASRGPPSSDRDTWTLVSLVMRESVHVLRAIGWYDGDVEPIAACLSLLSKMRRPSQVCSDQMMT